MTSSSSFSARVLFLPSILYVSPLPSPAKTFLGAPLSCTTPPPPRTYTGGTPPPCRDVRPFAKSLESGSYKEKGRGKGTCADIFLHPGRGRAIEGERVGGDKKEKGRNGDTGRERCCQEIAIEYGSASGKDFKMNKYCIPFLAHCTKYYDVDGNWLYIFFIKKEKRCPLLLLCGVHLT